VDFPDRLRPVLDLRNLDRIQALQFGLTVITRQTIFRISAIIDLPEHRLHWIPF
jgi:hypothetical protein